MASELNNEWIVTSFGLEWRLWIVPAAERAAPGPSRVDLVGNANPIADLIYFGFIDGDSRVEAREEPLLEIYDVLTGRDAIGANRYRDRRAADSQSQRDFERELEYVLYTAIEHGALRFERTTPLAWPFPDDEDLPPEKDETPPAAVEDLGFVALEIVDQTGKPVPRRGFHLVLPDETEREGFLDSEGQVFLRDVPHGTCRLTLPDLDVTDFMPPTIAAGRVRTDAVGPVLADDLGDADAVTESVYQIVSGDTLSSLAERFQFLHFATIWNAEDNAALRDARESPHVLFPGDTIVLPDRRPREMTIPTDAKRRLVVFREELHVKVRVRDLNGDEVALDGALAFIDGEPTDASIAGDAIDVTLPRRDAQVVSLQLGDASWDFRVGELVPIREAGGTEGRLENLALGAFGSLDPEIFDPDDPDALEARSLALELFQESVGRSPSGDDRDGTLDDLKDQAGA